MEKKRFSCSEDLAGYMLDKVSREFEELMTIAFVGYDANVLEGDDEWVIATGKDNEIVAACIIKACLKRKVRTIALAHYHKDGDPMPSEKDIEVTKEVKEYLNENGMYVLDHVVLTDSQYYSFADELKHELSELKH